jgi:hypothetical protein
MKESPVPIGVIYCQIQFKTPNKVVAQCPKTEATAGGPGIDVHNEKKKSRCSV